MIKTYLAQLKEKSGFEKLESREKITVVMGGCFIACFLILQFCVVPYMDARAKLDKSIAKRKADIIELKLLRRQYQDLQKETGGIKEQLQRRQDNFSLFSFLDRQAAAVEIKDLISYMKPSTSQSEGDLVESLVEMKLKKISLKQLVAYLERIESPENVVSIKRISIQESGKEKGELEVIIQIVTFAENG